jgi:thiol-disulfide isomerase/thioredoxin
MFKLADLSVAKPKRKSKRFSRGNAEFYSALKVKPKPASKKAVSKPEVSPTTKKKGRLLEFYGTECSHCIAMAPMIERLERELGVKIEKIEVWHNKQNEMLMTQYDRGYCGGVPFFYNETTKKWICGEADYSTLKKWALGK